MTNMTAHQHLIRQKRDHLTRMRTYQAYSHAQTAPLILIKDWADLTPK